MLPRFRRSLRTGLGRLASGAARLVLSLALSLGALGASSLDPGRVPVARADTVLVTSQEDIAGYDCVNLILMKCTLRGAIATAADGDTIQLPLTGLSVTLDGSLGTLIVNKSLTIGVVVPGVVFEIDGSHLSGPVLWIAAGTLNLSGVAIQDGPEGGVYVSPGAALNLSDGAVVDNDNTGLTNEGVITATNVTISGNTGGGLINTGAGTVLLNNATVASNTGLVAFAGGISNNGGVVTLRNSILANNTAGGQPSNCRNTLTSLGHNVVSGVNAACVFSSVETDEVGEDARLGPLQMNGGPSPTHALLPGSPALDAANPEACPEVDQRGARRRTGGEPVKWQGAGCDIGAFELPVVRLQAAEFRAGEAGGAGVITATLDISLSFALTAHFSTADGTAKAGADYTAVTAGQILFGPVSTTATGTVPILGDPLYTGEKWLTVSLTDTVGMAMGAPTSARLNLEDAQSPPIAALSGTSYSVLKSDGSVVVTATLNTPAGITVTLPYGTADGTAVAGRDYVAKSGTFTFPPNTTAQTTTIFLINDGAYYGDRTFSFVLNGPLSATLGAPAAAAVTIIDTNPRRVFLPVVAAPFVEVEPNDSTAQATGPMPPGVKYTGSNRGSFDPDFYFFEMSSAGPITVLVEGLTFTPGGSTNGQVQLRYDNGDSVPLVAFAGGPPYQINYNGLSGVYYIVVWTPTGYSGGPYSVTVTYP